MSPVTAQLEVEPILAEVSLKTRIYDSLKQAITRMNIYTEGGNLRLDERQLSEHLQISRTPLREALATLNLAAHVKAYVPYLD